MRPPARPQPPSRPALPWVLFGLSGRIGRSVYWLAYGALMAANAAVVLQVLGGPEQASGFDLAAGIAPGVGLVTLWSNIAVSVKRLHDVGMSGFLALALLVPFVNLAFSIWIGVVPGTAGPNRFGDRADVPPT